MTFHLIRLLSKNQLFLMDQENNKHLFVGWDSNSHIVTEFNGIFKSYSEKEIKNWTIQTSKWKVEEFTGYLC